MVIKVFTLGGQLSRAVLAQFDLQVRLRFKLAPFSHVYTPFSWHS